MLTLNHPLLSKQVDLDSKEEIIEGITSLMNIEELHHALSISHADFYSQLEKNLKSGNEADLAKLTKIYLTLYKFLSRISFRSTPYGLFSGIAVAEIGNENPSQVLSKKTMQVDVQPQLHDYIKFVSNLNLSFFINYKIKFFVNPSLYSLHDKFYFVEKNLDQDNNAALVNVSKNRILKLIIDHCKSSYRSIKEITSFLTADEKNYTTEELTQYISQLISSQILLPDLYLNPSQDDLTTNILKKLDFVKNAPEVTEYYHYVSEIAKVKILNNVISLKDLKRKHFNKTISVDTRMTTDKIVIPSTIVDLITQQCYDLFLKMRNRNAPYLDTFISKYQDKYEQAQISLLEVLDPNYGIGYAEFSIGNAEYQPLTNGLNFSSNSSLPNHFNPIDEVVEKAIYHFLDSKQQVIDIENFLDNVPALQKGQIPVKESAYIFGNLSLRKDSGTFTFFPDQIYANQASKLLKRFSSLGNDISDFISEIYTQEQNINSDAILAEVITIPNNAYSNIVLSTVSRKGEIPHFTNYNKSNTNIELRDITVCIQEGKVRLFSKKLKKEIIPVVSHPYNTYLEDPICKFLSDVANQFTGGGRFWNWGKYAQWEHLPRISYKNIIISRESWCIVKSSNPYSNLAEADQLIKGLIKDRKIPQKVIMSNAIHSDNEIILDLSLSVCRQILAKEINFNTIYLFEDIYSESKFLQGDEGYYNTELVIPYLNKNPKYHSPIQRNSSDQKRLFLPADQWLYVKIYGGSKLVEKILTSVILPFSEKFRKNKVIDQWFFIKYNDPDYHLRVRFHRSADSSEVEWQGLLYHLTTSLSKKFGSSFHYKLTVDTYKREIERYGKLPLETSETLFYFDSLSIASFIKDLNGDIGETYRYKFAFLNIDNLLDSFQYSLQEKKVILSNINQDFFNEHKEFFAQEKTLRQFLNKRYRELKDQITDTVDNTSETHQELAPYLEKREKFIKKNVLLFEGSLQHLIYSYIHMTLNRLFLINPRHHELLVYHLLNKYYESEIAKQKY